jgi:Sulfotransferase family
VGSPLSSREEASRSSHRGLKPFRDQSGLGRSRAFASRPPAGSTRLGRVSLYNERLLFIHVPKTGGTWATHALRGAGVEFEPVYKPIGPDTTRHHPTREEISVTGRFTFAFVREPLSWYGSLYNYRRQKRFNDGSFPGERFLDSEFPDFLAQMVKHHPGFVSTVYESFCGPPQDEIDFIGRYERLTDDLVRALQMAGQEFDEDALRAFPPLNQSMPTPDCPDRIRLGLLHSERAVYERFYPEAWADRITEGSEGSSGEMDASVG